MAIKFIFTLLSILLISCATNPGQYRSEETAEKKLMSMTEEEIAVNLGAPTEQVKLSNGAEAWTYRDEVKGVTGGYCTVSLILKKGRVLQASVTAKDRSWISFPLGSCTNLFGNFQ